MRRPGSLDHLLGLVPGGWPRHIDVMRLFLTAIAGLLLLVSPSVAAPVDTGHLQAELVAQETTVAPGGTTYVALRQKIDKGWHTYWRNPGDSGEATRLAWTLPAGWQAGEIVWAAPSRLPFGPLTNYGYSGTVTLPVPVVVPADAIPGSTVTLRARAAFLVCETICIPEEAALSLTLKVAYGAPQADPRWAPVVAKALEQAPKPAGLKAGYQWSEGRLSLAVAGPPLMGARPSQAYFYPFEPAWIEHAGVQTIDLGPTGLTLTLPPGYQFESGRPPAALSGVLVLDDQSFEISAQAGPSPAGAGGLGPPPSGSGAANGMSLGLAIGFAVLGGLILNLMPCVFPVLSMKAAALAGHANDRKGARAQGLAYGAGVLSTFLLLAVLLIGLKLAGAAVGWGFQLQSPPVVAVLALLMMAVALNMSGLFEVGEGLQGLGQGLAGQGGLVGSFFTGSLAVVVASPCTAPFMGPAMGFALAQSPAVILAVFAALAAGFAAPFVLLALAPALLSGLPRPGPWMNRLRAALAFPMYGAAAWLVWVLAQQTDPGGLAAVLASLVLAAFSFWLLGLFQQGGKAWILWIALAGLVLALAAAVMLPHGTPVAEGANQTTDQGAAVPHEAWSPARVAALRAEGKPVLVNFTAAWCVTCQVNEKVALSTPQVAQALRSSGAVYLKADWTRRDSTIAVALAEHGRAGVPLYLLYRPGLEAPMILPQLLTPGLVAEALTNAAVTPPGPAAR